jgi:hypothetical protein
MRIIPYLIGLHVPHGCQAPLIPFGVLVLTGPFPPLLSG